MEYMLLNNQFDETTPLFGMALKTYQQAPNQLKYWYHGYAFYKRENGTIFGEELEKELLHNFCWNSCAIKEDFPINLEQMKPSYRTAIEKLERLTSLSAPYGVAPITCDIALSRRNEPVVENLVFITKKENLFFKVETLEEFFNITTKTSTILSTYSENTMLTPHIISIDGNGNIHYKN